MAILIKDGWDSKIKPVSGPQINESFHVDNEPDSNGKFTGTYNFDDGTHATFDDGKYKSNTPPALDHISFSVKHTGKKKKFTFNGDLVVVGTGAKTQNGKRHKDDLPLVAHLVDPDDDWSGTHAT